MAGRSVDGGDGAVSTSTAAASTSARTSPSKARASRRASSTQRYPGRGCAIALEFKKFFMDEWSGEPDPDEVAAMRAFIAHIAAVAERMLAR